MSQNDLVIDNQSFPATRSDINSALQALGSLNSGATAPATTYANMLWYDTTNNTLKMRSEANDQWISVGYLDQSADAFRIFDDTQVVNTSGTQTGLIGDQATATWEAGTGTTESLVSPAKVKAAVKPALNATGTAPIYACRAWVNFNGTGTVAIRASGNVSSITDNGTGDYTVNFTTTMPDADYAVIVTNSNDEDGNPINAMVHSRGAIDTPPTTSSCRVFIGLSGTTLSRDREYVNVSIFR